MADFSYVAINKEGKEVKGSMAAKDMAEVRSKLRLDGMRPVSVKAQNIFTKDIQIGGEGKVSTRDLSVFCRQFSSVLTAGVTVVDALRMLAEQTENKVLKKALIKTKELVQQGETLADAMRKSPKVFPEMFVNMVEAGEASGSLDICIDRMGTQFEKSAKLSGMVKSAMMYPIAVIVIALVVLIVMSLFVVPKFAGMFADMGQELPLITRIVMAFSDFLMSKWLLLLLIIAIVAVLLTAYGKTNQGKHVYGRIAVSVPIFGKLSMKSNAAKFSRTMSTLVASGMGITSAIEITAKTMTNILYKDALDRAKLEVEQGIPLSVPIRKTPEFPAMVHNMLAIGEETGNIENMLDKVADYFEEETELATKNMSELLQPIIIVVLGGIVAVMVLAMYMPMISMYGSAGNI